MLHTPDQALGQWLPSSYLAVDLFFVLSGFVLAHAYGARLERGLSALGFMVHRLIRLYPLYAVGTTLGIAAFLSQVAMGERSFVLGRFVLSGLGAMFFLPVSPGASVGGVSFPFNGPAWSLFWELAVNVAFGALALKLEGRRLWMLVVVALAALVAGTFYYGDLATGWNWRNFMGGGTRVGYSFFAGVLIYRLWRSGRLRPVMPTWAASLVLLAVFAVPLDIAARTVFDLVAAMLIFPALIAASTSTRPSWLSRLLGRASYGVYALHVPIMWLGVLYVPELRGPAGTIVLPLAAFAAALALDRPETVLRAWLLRKYAGLTARGPSALSRPEGPEDPRTLRKLHPPPG